MNSVKVLQKTAIVSENIDVVRELIMQDCHVTHREIEAYLGIFFTSIHSILHEHRKKILLSFDPAQLVICCGVAGRA